MAWGTAALSCVAALFLCAQTYSTFAEAGRIVAAYESGEKTLEAEVRAIDARALVAKARSRLGAMQEKAEAAMEAGRSSGLDEGEGSDSGGAEEGVRGGGKGEGRGEVGDAEAERERLLGALREELRDAKGLLSNLDAKIRETRRSMDRYIDEISQSGSRMLYNYI